MVTQQQIPNSAETVLSAPSASSDTSISVLNASDFPTEGVFHVIVDNEIMVVTQVGGNTFTVTRAAGVDHVNGSQVRAVVAQESIDRFLAEQCFPMSPQRPAFRIAGTDGNILTSSSFTVVNGSTLTLIDDPGGAIIMRQPTRVVTTIAQIVRPAPATPYVITGAYRLNVVSATGAEGGIYGPHFRRSSNNSTLNWRHRPFDQLSERWRVDHNLADVFQNGVNAFRRFEPSPAGIVWFKLEDDGVDLQMRVSFDGIYFISVFTQGRTVELGGAPDQVGMSIDNLSTNEGYVQLLAWQE